MITAALDVYRGIRYPVLRKIAGLEKPPVVYTVGARGGLPSSRLAYLQRRKAIYSIGFEPDPEEARQCEKAGILNKVVPYALGARNGEATLYLTKMRGASSLYKPNLKRLKLLTPLAGEFEIEMEVKVELRRLDEVVSEFSLPMPNLIHIDAQASEMDILIGSGEILNQASVITIEAHMYEIYENQKLLHELVEWFDEKGFLCCQIDDPNENPVFSPHFVEANVSFVNIEKLGRDHRYTQLLMDLARLGERSNNKLKKTIHKLLFS